MKTFRIEANPGAVVCFGIVSATLGLIVMNCTKEKTKKYIETKKIESELRARHADYVAGCK